MAANISTAKELGPVNAYESNNGVVVVPPQIETAFRRVYGYLQHYAVGLEQATLDQMFTHEGRFANLFREIQNSLRQFLCDFDMSIHMLKIQKDPDVLRDVMSVEQREISGEHRITLRDYMILRDYIEMVRYINKLFGYLARHPEKSPAYILRESMMDDSAMSQSPQSQSQPPPPPPLPASSAL